ncbi:MAG: helix-turn-helix domain-containing protein [Altererythrobacter ishigakiensis]|nr:helix-turn-helix domain-containing protein [Altererythrobacter ishigakiensis]
MSFNRSPADDLSPWVGRVMVAITHATPDAAANGVLCNDAAYVRTAVDAHWTVETADRTMEISGQTFLCGQHDHAMPLQYKGPIKVAGMMLRPGAMRALFGVNDGTMLQRISYFNEIGIPDKEVTGLYHPGIEASTWLEKLEHWLRQHIVRSEAPLPDPLSQRFEEAAFADPNQSVTDFADQHCVTTRTLQRTIRRDFGLTPKQVLRRARILDLAARLCGVADEAEEEIFLRFFDQSHQIHEFTRFFGITPHAFRAERNALLTLSLEIRQARRLELLDRIAPGAVRPWMRKPFLPKQG